MARPTHIEDYLMQLHQGQWFGWIDSKNKVYANLILHDNTKSKPTEQECSDGLVQIQTNFDNEKTKQDNDSASGKTKLKDLGLTDDEIKALTGK
jgi:hypothetical protein